jgi:serine/threonine protein kinase
LHSNGLVFGDLRLPNTMITKANEVRLIDFNWAGEEGQTKYPYLISPGIDWPAGVEALAVIEKGHDLEMLNKLSVAFVPLHH